jgi:hypothetical protein
VNVNLLLVTESVDEELDGQISENLVASREYSMLMQSMDPELIEV